MSETCRLKESAAREQRNAATIRELQLASEARFGQLQSGFGEAMRGASGLLQQSSTHLQALSDQKERDAVALQVTSAIRRSTRLRLSLNLAFSCLQ